MTHIELTTTGHGVQLWRLAACV